MAKNTMTNWQEMHGILMIDLPTEFNFASNLAYLHRNKNECMFEVVDNKVTRVIVIDDERILVQISSPNNSQLFIRFLAGTRPDSVDDRAAVVAYIYDWFDLHTDLKPFYKMALKNPLLKQTIKKSYGLRIIGIPELFEALCWGVLGQQINLAFAYTLKRQFVEKFGEAIKYNGKPYWVFPTYEKIATLEPEDLTDIKMTVRKSEYIIGIAKLMTVGNLSKEMLVELNDFKKTEKELVKIRGIGPWTANYVLMRCLRYHEAFPIADVGLLNSIKCVNEMERKPTKEEVLELAIPWKDWEAYATFYLWRVLY